MKSKTRAPPIQQTKLSFHSFLWEWKEWRKLVVDGHWRQGAHNKRNSINQPTINFIELLKLIWFHFFVEWARSTTNSINQPTKQIKTKSFWFDWLIRWSWCCPLLFCCLCFVEFASSFKRAKGPQRPSTLFLLIELPIRKSNSNKERSWMASGYVRLLVSRHFIH